MLKTLFLYLVLSNLNLSLFMSGDSDDDDQVGSILIHLRGRVSSLFDDSDDVQFGSGIFNNIRERLSSRLGFDNDYSVEESFDIS